MSAARTSVIGPGAPISPDTSHHGQFQVPVPTEHPRPPQLPQRTNVVPLHDGHPENSELSPSSPRSATPLAPAPDVSTTDRVTSSNPVGVASARPTSSVRWTEQRNGIQAAGKRPLPTGFGGES